MRHLSRGLRRHLSRGLRRHLSRHVFAHMHDRNVYHNQKIMAYVYIILFALL
jgi:hypothetical protein